MYVHIADTEGLFLAINYVQLYSNYNYYENRLVDLRVAELVPLICSEVDVLSIVILSASAFIT